MILKFDNFILIFEGVDGILCTLNDKIDSELLDAAGPNLKVVSTFSGCNFTN